jgi:hypothetical protein
MINDLYDLCCDLWLYSSFQSLSRLLIYISFQRVFHLYIQETLMEL